MNTFLKTFILCLVLTLGFVVYQCIHNDSYSSNLTVSRQNPIFGLHQNNAADDNNNDKTVTEQQPVDANAKTDKPKSQKYAHTCYFFSASGQLIPIKRELSQKVSLESAINILLKGPTIAETKKGIYSEIPANVDLINLTRKENSIIVNLSSNFGNGGGSQSVENRIKQLAKTVKSLEPKKSVYLYINGEEVEYLGGDGVYIKQPLE